MGEDYQPRWRRRSRRAGSAASRTSATPALFFATDEAAYITGQTLVVDGGQMLPESLMALGRPMPNRRLGPGRRRAYAVASWTRSPAVRCCRASGSAPSATWPSATASAARRCARRSTRSSRQAPCGACPAARVGRSWPSARSSATSRASRACRRTCGDRASRAARGCSPPRRARPTPRRAEALAIPVGSLVFEIVRIRLADGEPISHERARFPAARFPGLLDRPLGGSLYALLESDYGLVPGEAEERIEIVSASATAARVLGVRRSLPSSRSRGSRSTPTAGRSSSRTTCSAPTACASSCALAQTAERRGS